MRRDTWQHPVRHAVRVGLLQVAASAKPNMRKLMIRTGLTIGVLIAAPAAAVPCGAVLTAPVVLTADVVCGPGKDGLIVAASNVTIDLNGFSVVGPWSAGGGSPPATGILASGVDAVTIRGPGRIEGFPTPIAIDGGVAHTIRGIEAIAYWGNYTTLRNVSLSLIEASVITRLALVADPGLDARENQIVRNNIGGPGGGGIWLYGCGAILNQVYANRIDSQYGVAIGLFEGANDNRVQGNRIKNGNIRLMGASVNTIVNNRITNDPYTADGISLEDAQSAGPCGTESMKNRIIANQVIGGQIGVNLPSSFLGAGAANQNLIGDNTFSDLKYSGFFFGSATFDNDARSNKYFNVPRIAYDYGSGNLWP